MFKQKRQKKLKKMLQKIKRKEEESLAYNYELYKHS